MFLFNYSSNDSSTEFGTSSSTENIINKLWIRIEKQIGAIPFCIKFFLYKSGFDTILSIIYEENLVESVEQFEVSIFDDIKKMLLTENLDTYLYLGPYDCMKKFTLLPGKCQLIN
jgi:hypothetical protein